ncbi:hypothetical protein GKE82_23850 [Conexibacter sp. W3-3-2]|uniref:hypothetical protein n=1 Tax=Conexibacter sp. W3-3-2 TaxID=2675227 RepID=UPI0012B76E8D|nr:hypothetical protein [Conexibacter sp. W3-3-2]MTD47241.1 hypothetical protein [Conexibacter sp. W3-3-2]
MVSIEIFRHYATLLPQSDGPQGWTDLIDALLQAPSDAVRQALDENAAQVGAPREGVRVRFELSAERARSLDVLRNSIQRAGEPRLTRSRVIRAVLADGSRSRQHLKRHPA